ncbi:MAG: fluoride efflux transporter CrcB [Actinobacteria bacterium]|nr:MAG: fluoride efflux transporter CrcB [Actinomycetota bacterium]
MEAGLYKYLLVGLGGFVGATSRYGIDALIRRLAGSHFPFGTLVVNVTGSFLLGFLFAAAFDRLTHDHALTLLVASGFIGAYTTFSTFMLDSVRLADAGGLSLAALNLAASLGSGLVAVWLGMLVGRLFNTA